MSKKLRIAWFSPLNTTPRLGSSVSAYFSDVTLPLLKEQFEIDLFHDSFTAYKDYATWHYLRAFKKHEEKPYDIFFYQIEDAKASAFVRMHCGLIPGVVLFHDLTLTQDAPVPILDSPWRDVLQKFQNPQAPWPARKKPEPVKEKNSEQDKSKKPKTRDPLARREANYASMALFSSERDNEIFQREIKSQKTALATDSFLLPFPVDFSALNNPEKENSTNIGFCGSPWIEHRAYKLLQALSEIDKPYKLHWLVSEKQKEKAQELLNEFSITSAEIHAPRTPRNWQALTAEIDIAVHTHYSAYGQPGPYLPISLARGLPSIVSAFGATDCLSPEVVFKVAPGDTEARELHGVIDTLLNNTTSFNSATVLNYAKEQHDSKRVAAELSQVFSDWALVHKKSLKNWQSYENRAREEILTNALDTGWESLSTTAEQKLLLQSAGLKAAFTDLGWQTDEH